MSRSTQVLTTKVKLNNELAARITIEERISRIFYGIKVHSVSTKYDGTVLAKKTVLENGISHGFAAAIIHAYNNDQHLRITPDDVWLTIAQGVGQHINYNSEKFRDRFVQHEGKKDVEVLAEDILDLADGCLTGDWPEAINRLVILTDENIVEKNLKSLLECDFSTSTSTSRTASKIVLLDAVKAYFNYRVRGGCGIPKITLEGTLSDWIKIQEKVRELRRLSLEMDFWLDRLDPVINNLVATYRGEIDEDYWSRISSKESFESGSTISGWMLGFFPYNSIGMPINNSTISPYDIPDGRVEVPFTTNLGLKLKFVAGFIGTNQEALANSDNEVVISPIIGWSIVENMDNKLNNWPF